MATLQLKTNEQNFINGLKKASGSVGELAGVMNVKLANSFKSADFYSKNFEKGIGRLSSAFKEAGQGMTLGLTLPLAFLAKSASDAYAEFDALKKGLGTLEKTSVGLTSRLKELREIAKAPGIGFQEAIQGDLRLRSVGISADTSAKILKEFANAVALTGGGKEQLNEITVQLGQMSAKGKVLAQDLRPIIEAAPMVSQALKNMFGTVSSEAISEQLEKTGKSSTDMINMLLAELEKAPRVTGGWKNALENLGTSLFVAKAEMFEVADKVFDLQGKMASITKTVEGFVEGFKNLPEPVQKVILGMTALVAILGPASYGLGLLANGISLAVTSAGLATLGIGALVAVVGTLAFAMFSSIAATEKFNKTTQDLSKTKQEAVKETDKEVRKIQDLISVIQKGQVKTTEFKNAKQELLRINPEYKAALVGETVDYAKLNDVTSKTVTNLMRIAEKKKLLAQQEAALAAVSELRSGGGITAMETLDAFLSSDVTEIYKKRIESFGGLLDYEKQLVYNKAYSLLSTVQDINAELKKEYADVLIPSDSPSGKASSGLGKDSDPIKNTGKKRLDAFIKMHTDEMQLRNKQLKDRLEQEKDIALAIAEEMDMSNLPDAPEVNRDRANDLNWKFTFGNNAPILKGLSEDEVKGWDDLNKIAKDGQNKYVEQFENMQEDMHNILGEMSVDFGANLLEDLVAGEGFQGAFSGLMKSLGAVMIDFGKKALIANEAFAAFKMAFNISPGSKGATVKALGLIAGGAIMKGLGSKIPKLAQGGMATNPTLAMIGDNKSGKEMVLPFERTGEFANMIASKMSGGGGEFIHTTRISGNDLLILTERAKRAR
jgi:tape measure domain-containing protein